MKRKGLPIVAIVLSILLQKAIAQTTFTINCQNQNQTIHDFGASGAWNSEVIGKYWPEEKKNRIAELLFSPETDQAGNPKGIALSSYRFNIGAGTTEQGEASNIPDPQRRTECFLDAKGKYDFTKQAGYQWFVRKAKDYGVPTLIGFVNSPPVFMNQNGLGFKSNKDGHANLKPEKYTEFADFLASVMQYFDREGLHLSCVSPVNEPQWEWTIDSKGKSSQEGSPYFNTEIAAVTRKIDSVFTKRKIGTQIFVAENGSMDRLFQGNSWADNQIDNLWNPQSSNYIGGLKNVVGNAVSSHSYWTESTTAKLIENRQKLFQKLQSTNKGLQFWQTEYSFLGDGYKEGSAQKRSQIDCALFLAKVIYHDLTLANAPVWQFWTAVDGTRPTAEIRYNLICAIENKDKTDGDFYDTKSLWALGNYSRFVRPGMIRVATDRNDGLSLEQAANKLMLSAYFDEATHKLVIVAINYDTQPQEIHLKLNDFKFKVSSLKPYITSEQDNLKAYPEVRVNDGITLKARSITTFVSR
ncbi:O-glycosyl hydrolase [Mucilaginibacter yixingensis]|uniref:O-glycosyl hydrolase n=1 Tax=Mucilaginibacter yixingensis TaxID=1295612 RepID=A0A2T5JAG1_9SPHI|nr:glycoside hydrolase [Mucilaginibacter yixingensis]PTQ97861.1 O-glycosyl hydrolase [Mucilaginibacter yixingensis]